MAMALSRKRNPLICQYCYKPERFDNMVKCDKCPEWAHLSCAGVGPKIKDNDWQCPICKVKMSRHTSCHSKTGEKSKIPIPIKTNGRMLKHVTAAEMVAVQKEVKNVKIGQTKIIESVAATAAYAEAVEKDVEVLHSDHKDVKAVVYALQKDFDEIKETMKEVKLTESTPSYQLSTLPSKTLIELQDLLTYVQNAAGYVEFKSYIAALCGNDLQKSIRKILFNIMDKDVQKQLSWSGMRTTKPSFEEMYKRILDAIKETLNEKFKDYNYDLLKKKISTLLNNA